MNSGVIRGYFLIACLKMLEGRSTFHPYSINQNFIGALPRFLCSKSSPPAQLCTTRVKCKSQYVKLKIIEFSTDQMKSVRKKTESEFVDVCRYAKRRLRRRKWGGLWDREEAYNYIHNLQYPPSLLCHTQYKKAYFPHCQKKEKKPTTQLGSKDTD